MQVDKATALAGKYMAFKLASEEFGLGILHVQEIIRLMDITPMPRTEPYIRGVINLRGKVHPVVDLRTRFGMDPTADTDQTVIIVVHFERDGEDAVMGILVDQVLEVLDIPDAQIEPPPDFEGSSQDFILGVAKADDRILFLLDISSVLAPQHTQQAA